MSNVVEVSKAAKKAASSLISLDTEKKNELLRAIAVDIENNIPRIEKANAVDVLHCDRPPAFIDRLKFTASRIRDAAKGLIELTELSDPVGKAIDERTLYNGLKLKKVTVPMGVIAIIYEARPNVTVDAVGLCLKASSAVVLRGGKEAIETNRVVVSIIRETLKRFGVDENAIGLAECDHDGTKELLSLESYIDLAIPRGSKNLIEFVRKNALVPTIETGAGNCSAYIDATADINKATEIIINAKTQRLGVCNALESLLIERKALNGSLPVLDALDNVGVTIHADEEVIKVFDRAVPADESDYYKEYLSMDISVKTVKDVKEAVEAINKYGTHHSDTILSEDKSAIEYFYKYVDSAVVYSNASTRFTDGGQFGLGAEIGISTQKIGARGPMGLDEIVTYKYIVEGNGQTRA